MPSTFTPPLVAKEWAGAVKDLRASVTEEKIEVSGRLLADEKKFVNEMFREGWGQGREGDQREDAFKDGHQIRQGDEPRPG